MTTRHKCDLLFEHFVCACACEERERGGGGRGGRRKEGGSDGAFFASNTHRTHWSVGECRTNKRNVRWQEREGGGGGRVCVWNWGEVLIRTRGSGEQEGGDEVDFCPTRTQRKDFPQVSHKR
jgi:hypothetical protein